MNKKEILVILGATLISFAVGYCAKKEPVAKKIVVFETVIHSEYIDECRPD